MTPARLTTTKATSETLKLIRLVAAVTGEKQYAVLVRLLQAEVRRLQITSSTGAAKA